MTVSSSNPPQQVRDAIPFYNTGGNNGLVEYDDNVNPMWSDMISTEEMKKGMRFNTKDELITFINQWHVVTTVITKFESLSQPNGTSSVRKRRSRDANGGCVLVRKSLRGSSSYLSWRVPIPVLTQCLGGPTKELTQNFRVISSYLMLEKI